MKSMLICLYLICVLFGFPQIAVSDDLNGKQPSEQNNQQVNQPKSNVDDVYCGINCLYVACKLVGGDIKYSELVQPDYLNMRKGSTVIQLKSAAEAVGLYAVAVSGVTLDTLRNCHFPVILHTKPSLEEREFKHYELVIGTEDEKLLMLNPPDILSWLSYGEVLPRINGVGLIIANEPIQMSSLTRPSRRSFVKWIVLCIGIVTVYYVIKRWYLINGTYTRRAYIALSIVQMTILVAVSVLLLMYHNFLYIGNSSIKLDAVKAIQQAHLTDFIPRIGYRTVQRMLKSNSALLVDARLKEDFKKGHIKDAISIPVDGNDIKLHETSLEFGSDKHVIVYCQSDNCDFADKVAVRLIKNGVVKVCIYTAGWNEWHSRSQRQELEALTLDQT